MEKKILLLFLITLLAGVPGGISAQDKATVDQLKGYSAAADTASGWKFSGLTGLTFGQTSLTNWKAGGDNTISGNATLNLTANYRNEKWFWDNTLFTEFGMIYSSANDWQKAADKVNLTSVGGRSISKYWSFSALFNFKTQFAKGYDYPDKDKYLSTFMAPAYADLALGFTYKPNANYSLFLSPLAERATIVLNDSLSDAGAFGVDPGDKIKLTTGAYLMATTNQTLWGNLSLISTLDMYTPYNKNFGNVDINWDLLLNYKLNKFFTVNLNTTLRYYDQEVKKVQFKEVFGLGVTYTF